MFINLGIYGILLFLVLARSGMEKWHEMYQGAPVILQMLGSIELIALAPGLAPALCALFLLLLESSLRINLYGTMVAVSVMLIHWLVFAYAKTVPLMYSLPVYLAELAIVVACLSVWRSRQPRRQGPEAESS